MENRTQNLTAEPIYMGSAFSLPGWRGVEFCGISQSIRASHLPLAANRRGLSFSPALPSVPLERGGVSFSSIPQLWAIFFGRATYEIGTVTKTKLDLRNHNFPTRVY